MYQILLILHFLALAMALGGSLSLAMHRHTAVRLEASEALPFMLKVGVLARMVDIGLALLILSGLAITLTNDGLIQAGGVWFHIKMAALLVLLAAHGFVRMQMGKMRRGDKPAAAAGRIRKVAPIGLGAAVLAVIFAVLAFN